MFGLFKQKIRPLQWRKPADDGADFGHEDSICTADALGGHFDICATTLIKKTGGPGFLLWLSLDPFIFEEHETEESARRSAEQHWQKSIRAVLV